MEKESKSSKTRKFRGGLAPILFAWFMVLSLGPIAVIGVNEYQEGRKSIVNNRYEDLSIINRLLSQRINDYFNSIVTNLYVKTEIAGNLLKELSKGYEKSGLSLEAFIGSTDYTDALNKGSTDLIDFLRYYDYSDVLLGDSNGNILYSVNTYNDLGTNLFSGELAHTEFATGARKAINTKEPQYVDIAPYPPLGDQKVSFFILPMVNDWGRVTGFLAVQILAYSVQSIFETDKELGSSLRSSLIGRDLYIRYGSGIDASQAMVLKSENSLTREWLSHLGEDDLFMELHDDEHLHDHDHGHEDDSDHAAELTELVEGEDHLDDPSLVADMTKEHIKEYQDVFDVPVLGTYHPIYVAGTPMALISEVNRDEAFSSVNQFRDRLIFITFATAFMVFLIALVITRQLTRPIRAMNEQVNQVAAGDYSQSKVLKCYREIKELSRSFTEMTDKLRELITENKRKSWRQDGIAGLNECMRGEQALSELCKNIVSYLARYLDMQAGAMYVMNGDQQLKLMGTFAWSVRKEGSNSFELGEGMVGQAALEKQMLELTDLPENYMVIKSGLGQSVPSSVIVIPLVYEGEVKGVIEFAQIKALNSEQSSFLEISLETIAIGLNSAQYRNRANQLLEQTTKQSEALKEQKEELKSVNDELESRAQILEESQEELKAQSEELQKSNAEMEEKTELLQLQKEEIELKNLDIELSKKSLEEKAVELEQASKYKSEFLANMSHELRTPLNSLLLLAQMLANNDDGNLSEDEVESASVIYKSGSELLSLINDILDLSKVEAGKMNVNLEDVDIEELCIGAKTLFKPLADDKGLDFNVNIEPGTSKVLLSDSQRIMQILKNFLSNAMKFTEKGGVYIQVSNTSRTTKYGDCTYVAFGVKDTGIGIPEHKQNAIFEAFQQADGSTSRKYGGTGLGLAISKELAGLLGGFIDLKSTAGEGTTFTLYLPDNAVCSLSSDHVVADNHSDEKSQGLKPDEPIKEKSRPVTSPEKNQSVTSKSSEKTFLIIEDDPQFSDIVCRLSKSNGYECLVAETGRQGISLAREHLPEAIILDLGLPDMDGNDVLSELKVHPETQNIPVHIVSGRDPEESDIKDAVGYLVKPVSVDDLNVVFDTFERLPEREVQSALLLDSDVESRSHLASLLELKGIKTTQVSTAAEAEAELSGNNWQCLIMDVELPDCSGFRFLERIQQKMAEKMPFIVIHTDKQLSREDNERYSQFTRAMVMKGEYASERVMDEVSLFIHSLKKGKPEPVEETVAVGGNSLEGHKVLLVDDDLRNTFALSKGLQAAGLEVVIADNGQRALDKLEEEEGIELVLMDIMMPVMDGYEAMTQMRKMDAFKDMPVIALTAKAMSDDKAKCINAGANDYMTKPVDLKKLLEMIKVWLFK